MDSGANNSTSNGLIMIKPNLVAELITTIRTSVLSSKLNDASEVEVAKKIFLRLERFSLSKLMLFN